MNSISDKSRTRNAAFNTAAGLAVKFLNVVTGLVMRTIFIRLLGIEYAGVSSLFTDILTALSLAELGVGSAIGYALYKPVANGDYRRAAALVDFYKKAYRFVAGAVLLLGLAVMPFLSYIVTDTPNIKENITLIYLLYVINSAVSYLLVYRSTLLSAHQEQRRASVIRMLVSLLRVGIEAAVLLIFKSFIAYLLVSIAMTWLQNVIISQEARRRYPEIDEYSKERLSKEERSALFKDIRALMLYKISSALTSGCDSVIVSALLGTSWVGMMGNYTLIMRRVTALVNQFYNSAAPSVGNLAAQSDGEKQYRTFKTIQFLAFWICCFCSVSFIVLFNPFVRVWFGKKYLLPMLFPIALTFFFFLNSMIRPVSTFRNANGLFIQGKYRPAVMVAINIVLSVIFVLYWRGQDNAVMGLIFVKLATSIAQLLTIQWYDPLLVYRKVFGVKFINYVKQFLIYLLFTTACCAVTYYIGVLIPVSNKYWVLAIRVLLCIVIPNLAVILAFGRSAEFLELRGMIKSVLTREKPPADERFDDR